MKNLFYFVLQVLCISLMVSYVYADSSLSPEEQSRPVPEGKLHDSNGGNVISIPVQCYDNQRTEQKNTGNNECIYATQKSLPETNKEDSYISTAILLLCSSVFIGMVALARRNVSERVN